MGFMSHGPSHQVLYLAQVNLKPVGILELNHETQSPKVKLHRLTIL